MITDHESYLEIKPVSNMGNETLMLDVDDRIITSIHIHEPRVGKYADLVKQLTKYYGFSPPCLILEVTTTPNKNVSASTKTITHQLVYYDINDLKRDFEFLKKYLTKS